MLECCQRLQNIDHKLLLNAKIGKSLASQFLCADPSNCIQHCDMICSYHEDVKDFFYELINTDIAIRCTLPPTINIVEHNCCKSVRLTAIPTIIEKIRQYCLGIYHKLPEIHGQVEDYEFNSVKIFCGEALCRTQYGERCKYNDSTLIGMLLGLGDVLLKSEYLQNDEYPQFSIAIDWKFRYRYNYTFLHDLAVYITLHKDLIDWNKIFCILSKCKANTPLVLLLNLFNHIYELIPNHLLNSFVENAIINDDGLASLEMLKQVNKYCTPNEILNNDYRNLFRALLFSNNINGREYLYGTLDTNLSLDESLLQYTLDKNTDNPYGSPVFSGNEYDQSDELSVSWGIWASNDNLCFLLKIHNKFIVPENPINWLNRCFTEIAIAAVDNDSHKFSELRINPSFSEEEKLNILITDNANGNYELDHDVVDYEYKFENNDIYVSMAISKSYLHIPKDGLFGLDILTYCAEPWSVYSGLVYRKVLTWTGCEEKWRDPRSYAIFKLNSQKL